MNGSTLMKLIDIIDFKKEYSNHTVNHPSITISKRVTIIKGENGKGKSTLLKGILGIIEYKGSILHNLEIAYMPEEMRIPHHLKVNSYLELMLPRNCYIEKNRLIQMFKMNEHKDKEIHELSKGMYLKTRLIYTLSLDKDMYILDEPFNGLDKESIHHLKKYIIESKKNFIISTHLNILTSLEADYIHI